MKSSIDGNIVLNSICIGLWETFLFPIALENFVDNVTEIKAFLSHYFTLEKLTPLNKGLSTLKYTYIVDKDDLRRFSSMGQIEQKDIEIGQKLLLRIYSASTHGERFYDFAIREQTALDWLEKQHFDKIQVPKFIGVVKTIKYHANIVTWVEGSSTCDMETLFDVWNFMDKHFIVTNPPPLPIHHDIIKESVFELKEFLMSTNFFSSNTKKLVSELDVNDLYPPPTHVIHGDFHRYNLIYNVPIGIIDWEYASLGDPWFDLIYELLYGFSLQSSLPIDEFLDNQLAKLNVTIPDNERILINSIMVLVVMAQWFFSRYKKTKREHNLQKGSRCLDGMLKLFQKL